MEAQRCIDCLCDTPSGSPAKCEECEKRDRTFGCFGHVNFFHGSPPCKKGIDSIDDDPDAYGRAEPD